MPEVIAPGTLNAGEAIGTSGLALVQNAAATLTLTSANVLVLSSVASAITLPPVTAGGRVVAITSAASAAQTLKSADGSLVNGVVGTTGVVGAATAGAVVSLTSDGSNWYSV